MAASGSVLSWKAAAADVGIQTSLERERETGTGGDRKVGFVRPKSMMGGALLSILHVASH